MKLLLLLLHLFMSVATSARFAGWGNTHDSGQAFAKQSPVRDRLVALCHARSLQTVFRDWKFSMVAMQELTPNHKVLQQQCVGNSYLLDTELSQGTRRYSNESWDPSSAMILGTAY